MLKVTPSLLALADESDSDVETKRHVKRPETYLPAHQGQVGGSRPIGSGGLKSGRPSGKCKPSEDDDCGPDEESELETLVASIANVLEAVSRGVPGESLGLCLASMRAAKQSVLRSRGAKAIGAEPRRRKVRTLDDEDEDDLQEEGEHHPEDDPEYQPSTHVSDAKASVHTHSLDDSDTSVGNAGNEGNEGDAHDSFIFNESTQQSGDESDASGDLLPVRGSTRKLRTLNDDEDDLREPCAVGQANERDVDSESSFRIEPIPTRRGAAFEGSYLSASQLEPSITAPLVSEAGASDLARITAEFQVLQLGDSTSPADLDRGAASTANQAFPEESHHNLSAFFGSESPEAVDDATSPPSSPKEFSLLLKNLDDENDAADSVVIDTVTGRSPTRYTPRNRQHRSEGQESPAALNLTSSFNLNTTDRDDTTEVRETLAMMLGPELDLDQFFSVESGGPEQEAELTGFNSSPSLPRHDLQVSDRQQLPVPRKSHAERKNSFGIQSTSIAQFVDLSDDESKGPLQRNDMSTQASEYNAHRTETIESIAREPSLRLSNLDLSSGVNNSSQSSKSHTTQHPDDVQKMAQHDDYSLDESIWQPTFRKTPSHEKHRRILESSDEEDMSVDGRAQESREEAEGLNRKQGNHQSVANDDVDDLALALDNLKFDQVGYMTAEPSLPKSTTQSDRGSNVRTPKSAVAGKKTYTPTKTDPQPKRRLRFVLEDSDDESDLVDAAISSSDDDMSEGGCESADDSEMSDFVVSDEDDEVGDDELGECGSPFMNGSDNTESDSSSGSEDESDEDRSDIPRRGIHTTPRRDRKHRKSQTTTPNSQSRSVVEDIKSFARRRNALTRKYFEEFNERIFDKGLPQDLPIRWNNRMSSTAGYCLAKRTGGTRVAEIQLATKVVDREERLRSTLCHEMCHAAAWLISGVTHPPHGPAFQAWAKKAMRVYRDIEVSTCHNYTIHYQHQYQCILCGQKYQRHSNSIDPKRHRCHVCHGEITYLGRFNADGTPIKTRGTPSKSGSAGGDLHSAPGSTNPYLAWCQQRRPQLKRERPDLGPRALMQALAAEWRALRASGAQVNVNTAEGKPARKATPGDRLKTKSAMSEFFDEDVEDGHDGQENVKPYAASSSVRSLEKEFNHELDNKQGETHYTALSESNSTGLFGGILRGLSESLRNLRL